MRIFSSIISTIASISALAVLFIAGTTGTLAAERAIVVFDASGSMWGQVDGKAKITIAREVLRETLQGWKDQDIELGLIAYGHRRKGACDDIETLIPTGPLDPQGFAATVDAIKPKGKTPLTAAVRKAAEELRYTEEKATVILLSDGLETCDLDPCAVAGELEGAGIDFTAHVIGFDITGGDERKQLSCIAENTGGTFVSAANAQELTKAFEQVIAAKPASFVAVSGLQGVAVPSPVSWQITGGEVDIRTQSQQSRLDIADLANGTYEVIAVAGPLKGSAQVTLADARSETEIVLNAELPEASVSGPQTVAALSEFEVTWSGPAGEGDQIQLSKPGAVPGTSFVQSADVGAGSPLTFEAPADRGDYELRYFSATFNKLLARSPVRVGEPAPSAVLNALDEVPAGSMFEIAWTGPGHEKDWIDIAEPGARPGIYHSYAYTKTGNPVEMRAPSKTGEWELRYINGTETKVMGRKKLIVTDAGVTLSSLDEVPAGHVFDLEWTGPGHERDWVDIAKPGAPPGTYHSYVLVRTGNPMQMRAPSNPGTWEIRYLNGSDTRIMGSKTLTVTDGGVTLNGLDEVKAGQTFELAWTGPGHQRDWIDIAEPGAPPGTYHSYVLVRTGNPTIMRAPSIPGTWEIRYLNGSDTSIMATKVLAVTDSGVTLSAVDEVRAGETLEVGWTGPGHQRDWIDIAEPGAKAGTYLTYSLVRTGNPVKIKAPAEPGEYEIRYLNGSDTQIMGKRTLTVLPGT